jgi:hypothetical protein
MQFKLEIKQKVSRITPFTVLFIVQNWRLFHENFDETCDKKIILSMISKNTHDFENDINPIHKSINYSHRIAIYCLADFTTICMKNLHIS